MQAKSKICVAVTGENLADFIKQLEIAQQEAEMIELRVDYLKDHKKLRIKYEPTDLILLKSQSMPILKRIRSEFYNF